MRRSILALGVAALASACDREGGPIAIRAPAGGVFVSDEAPAVVRVRAGAYDEVELAVDGGRPARLAVRDTGGAFVAALALSPGAHELVATVPGVPGAADVRRVFVARAPVAPVDGFGLAPGGTHAVALSDARPAGDGLRAGRLSVFSLAGEPFRRDLTAHGVFAEISAAGDVAWVDGWHDARGTLHVAPLAGEETFRLGRVRDFGFAPGGAVVAALDDGVVVARADGSGSRRIAHAARAFVFAGPGGDLVSFAGEDGANVRTATFAAAPDYVPVVLAAPVRPVIAANPARREAAVAEGDGGEPGRLVLYDFETGTAAHLFDAVAGFTFSRGGNWLLALTDVAGGVASVGLLARDAGEAAPVVLDGAFVRAGFDRSGGRVFAVEGGPLGVLRVAHLDEAPPVFVAVATHVADFVALPGDRMLLLTLDGELAVVGADDAVLELGRWNEDSPEVSLSPDGETLAFAADDGGRRPIRRVSLATGNVGDLGQDALRPAALGGGAVAWAERAAGGGADLWLLPAFPGSLAGPRRLAGGVATGRPFAVGPGGARFAAIAHGRSVCGDTSGRLVDLGAADPVRHEALFLADGRVGRFGVDGGDARVLFFQRCD